MNTRLSYILHSMAYIGAVVVIVATCTLVDTNTKLIDSKERYRNISKDLAVTQAVAKYKRLNNEK